MEYVSNRLKSTYTYHYIQNNTEMKSSGFSVIYIIKA